MKKVVQNTVPEIEDIRPVINDQIVDAVHKIFTSVVSLEVQKDIFEDLANRLIQDLKANSFMEEDLELSEEQKDLLIKVVKLRGEETVRNYLSKVNTDNRTLNIYAIVRERATAIADAVLSAIGQEINRGAIINARAVQANSKNDKYDEILLRKTKTSGDITVPTNCILLSTNCIEVIKASCQEEKEPEKPAEPAESTGATKKDAQKKPPKGEQK